MPCKSTIAAFHAEMAAWRQRIHANPETAFEEVATAELVAGLLREFGLEVHRGLAKTGVVGTLRCGSGGRSIGLRADMDALHIEELTNLPYRSRVPGKMHACGHDGHTAMLLGAAKYLAESRNFDGIVHFIFQPAEENVAGGRTMVEDGLFRLFPVEAVFGMHNMPGIEVGKMAMMPGPMMASADFFEIQITGKGAHAAFPHQGVDPVLLGAEIVMALQRIVSRTTDPLQAAVVSVTQFHAGHTTNVIPETAVLSGTTRALLPGVQDEIERAIRQIAAGIAQAHGASVLCRYDRRYPPTINTAAETAVSARAAGAVVGPGNVLSDLPPVMGAEDFAWMLRERPGCYVWIGNGREQGGCHVHNPHYDFNDAILPIGASYWATLVEQVLTAGK